ncbi:MAG: GNAT family N-acetyltransferase [Nocardioides sp.]|uniref:GNAT family N-acetyltransferase n=1 Tax=Nocardioides sp. TaxID=35761 RepID=UPI0039E2A171
MLTMRQGIRVLGPSDLDAFLTLVKRDPIVNVFADYRARSTSLEPRWLGGEMWGRFDGGDLVAACHVGANLVPIGCRPDDARAFGERALTRGRTVSTIVGPHDAVESLWDALGGAWGTPRETRWRQPHLQISGPPAADPDPLVRRTSRADLDAVYPACVAMYTEEVGISPESGGGAELYRARVLQLMARGWSFARFDTDGRLLFKAEVACSSPVAAQIQGVYVVPDRRGEGLGIRGMAAVVDLVRREIAPTVSLYVNDWNTAARRTYAAVGFVQSATFSTVMF